MALKRIEPADMLGKGVIGLEVIPGLDALSMQKKFDELVTDVVVPSYNGLVGELSGATGAAQIGTETGVTVQAALAAKAEASAVLSKTNAEAYSPAAPYHPATKKYVDDLQLESGTGDMTKAFYDTDNDGKVNAAQDADRLGGQLPASYGKAPLRLHTTIGTSWVGDEAPYTQTVMVAEMLERDCPHLAPVYAQETGTAVAQKEAWSMIDSADARDGSIVLSCFEDKPEIEIPVQIELLR